MSRTRYRSDQNHIRIWLIYIFFFFFFFCCNLCSSHKSRARYFCKKKSLQFFLFRLNHLSSVVAGFLPETSDFPIYQTCVGTIFWWGWRRLVGWRNCNIIMFKIQFNFFWLILVPFDLGFVGWRNKKTLTTSQFFLGSGFVFIWKFWKPKQNKQKVNKTKKT